MKKSQLALAISAVLYSTSLLAADIAQPQANKNNNYAITAPQQQQLGKHSTNKQLAEKRQQTLASIQDKVKSRLEQVGIKVTKQLKNLAAISFAELNDKQVAQLLLEGYTVEKLGYKTLVATAIQAQGTPWGIDKVRAPQAWTDNNAAGVKVCIIDTGIDYNHEDLADVFVTGISTVGNGSNDAMDTHYHGTHVSGTIAAADNDVGVVGVAPGAGLYNVGAFNSSGQAADADILEGLDWCAEQDADVVSMSYGGSETTQAEEIAYQAAYDSGMVLVAATGNDGATAPILFPGR
ncbi:MAG: S8 family serine peptidase, partial [Psychrosphaera sp.]|nr:S8 family serine peptidase [Psychrosphaera sp.]